jgi:hypothetical protein
MSPEERVGRRRLGFDKCNGQGLRVVDQERVRWERARFDELALKYRGEYDGWEAAV